MGIKKILLTGAAPVLALGLGAALLSSGTSVGFTTIGGSLSQNQRDFRTFNNFTDAAANNNQVADQMFPGYQGAVMAIWKASVEWGSELHGDGSGDPHQPGGLGSGGANFDPSMQGEATGVGGTNDNIHSEISGSSGGVLAFTETPISNGWRIRYYSGWTWADGPGTFISGIDLQGVACHEYGHALGLGHSGSGGATMFPSISGSGVGQRSIGADDIAGIQSIYGVKSASKPLVTGYTVNGNSITVMGSGFDSIANQVWFTQKSKGGNGVPIKVTNVTSNGSSLTVNVPANAGTGDLLVRRNNTSHSGLSNAWPFDPGTGGQICGITQYGLGQGGANIGTLSSASTPTLGTTISLVASSFAGASSGQVIFSLAQTSTPLFGGTLLMDFANPIATIPFTTTIGLGVIPVPLPSTPSLAYLDIYAQAGVLDAAQPFGWAFSNGLKVILCP
jgi:hypothetical protein